MRRFNHSKIKERRKRLGLSQRKLASTAGVTREHLAVIEKGKSIPKVDTVAKIAAALRVKESYFFKKNAKEDAL